MIKLLKLLILLAIPFLQLNAQTPINLNSGLDNLFLRVIEVADRDAISKEPTRIKGSIFLQDDFVAGEVLTANARYENLKLKYNILDDVFHFSVGRQEMVLDPKSDLKMVKVDNKVFVVRYFDYKTRSLVGFVEQLTEGKYSLFAKKNIALRPGSPPKALDTKTTPPMYIRPGDTYYLGMPDGSLQKITNGKDVVSILGNSKLADEAKNQKISLKKDEHLPALVQLVNEMRL